MEHRCSIRKSLELQVLLYKHGLPVQSGITRDLGLGGVFIQAGAYQWRKNELLEIEFLSADGSPAMRLRGVVVHLRGDGVGLMFDSVSGEQRRQLRAWLFRKNHSSPQESENKLEVA